MLSWLGKCAQDVCVKMGLEHILARMDQKVEVVDGGAEVLDSIVAVGTDIYSPA